MQNISLVNCIGNKSKVSICINIKNINSKKLRNVLSSLLKKKWAFRINAKNSSILFLFIFFPIYALLIYFSFLKDVWDTSNLSYFLSKWTMKFDQHNFMHINTCSLPTQQCKASAIDLHVTSSYFLSFNFSFLCIFKCKFWSKLNNLKI